MMEEYSIISTSHFIKRNSKSDDYLMVIIPVEATREMSLKAGQKFSFLGNGKNLMIEPLLGLKSQQLRTTKLSEIPVNTDNEHNSLAIISSHNLQETEISD